MLLFPLDLTIIPDVVVVGLKSKQMRKEKVKNKKKINAPWILVYNR